VFTKVGSAGHDSVKVTFEGKEIMATKGQSVAAVLLAEGIRSCRETPVSGDPRGPYCMMGVCFECLVVIDGEPNQQACMTAVRAGMVIERQHGVAQIGPQLDAEQGLAG
jgi:predicted molibdopterin-dependent oxidoreductase YjgC